MSSDLIEAEVCTENLEKVFFRPIGKALRGPADFAALRRPYAHDLQKRWRHPVPGQVLGVNVKTGEMYIRDPIHETRHAELRALIAKRGLRLPPEREEFKGGSIVTWLHWLAKEIEAGTMRLIAGTIPPLDSFSEKPRRHFISNEPPKNELAEAIGKLAAAVEANTQINQALLAKLAK